MLKNEWSIQEKSPEDVITYVERVRNRLEVASTLVRENMEKAQVKQKLWYNRTARETQLSEGDKVLLMLPTPN